MKKTPLACLGALGGLLAFSCASVQDLGQHGSGGGGSGGTETTTRSTGGASADGGSGGAEPEAPAPGIDGCAKVFVDADGVCRPSQDKCKAFPGTMPKFDTGCVPVGIVSCAPEFTHEPDGFCHPTIRQCAAGFYPLPTKGCVSIDGELGCSENDAYGDHGDGDDQFVDPSFTGPVSSGTRVAPWKTIADGLSHVHFGGRVRLTNGVYDERIVPTTSNVQVVGRCASMVTIVGAGKAANAPEPLVDVSNGLHFALAGVTLTGNGIGIHASAGANIEINDVVVGDTVEAGVKIEQATGKLTNVFVRGQATDDMEGGGIEVISSTVTIRDSAVFQVPSRGIYVNEDVEAELPVTISNVTIENITGSLAPMYASGIGLVFDRVKSNEIVENLAVVGTADAGVLVADSSHVSLANALIEGATPSTVSAAFDVEGDAQTETHLAAMQVLIMSSGGSGLLAAAGQVTLSDSLITGIEDNGYASAAFQVQGHGRLQATDCAVVDVVGNGAYVSNHSELDATRVLFERMKESTGSEFTVGYGLECLSSTCSLVDSAVTEATGSALYSLGNGTLSAKRTLVSSTRPSTTLAPVEAGGLGVEVLTGVVNLSRVRIEKSQAAGMSIVQGGGALTDVVIDGVAKGVLVRRVIPVETIADVGDGVIASQNEQSKVTIEATSVSGVARAGFLFNDSNGEIAGSRADGGLSGLVTQGTPKATLGPDNDFNGSREDNARDIGLTAP